jgi:Spy/CpxP family protein refolding chaperone
MKKIIALLLASTVVSFPTFAAPPPDKTQTDKPLTTMPSAHKGMKNSSGMKHECADEKAMHEGHFISGHLVNGMSDEQGIEIMIPSMHMLGGLHLSEEQLSKVKKLANQLKHDNWITQGLINDEMSKLEDLHDADKRDPEAIRKVYQKMFDLKLQIIAVDLETQDHIEEILNPEQRTKLKEFRRVKHHMQGGPMG